MKTARRQELRTNELAQQIDQVGEYVRQNAPTFTAVVVGAAVVFGGIYWYVKHRQNELMDAWRTLGQRAILTDKGPAIESYKEVARRNLEPRLTLRAWLKVGETALMENVKSGKGSGKAPSQDMLKDAEEAYAIVLASPNADGVAVGEAMIGMGVIAENRGDIAKAKEWYRKAADDARVKSTPLPVEAEHRYALADRWAAIVEFPPPPAPPAPLLPEATSAPASTQSAAAPAPAPPPASATPTAASAVPPPAASAPAGR